MRNAEEVSRLIVGSFKDGPSMIRDENAQLVGYVYVDIDPELTIRTFKFVGDGY